MADQKINALPVKTAPTTGDKMLMIGAAEEYQIDYDQLATAILNKLTSKTYALDQGTKTLIAALNELNSKTLFNLSTALLTDADDIKNSDPYRFYVHRYAPDTLNSPYKQDPPIGTDSGVIISYFSSINYGVQLAIPVNRSILIMRGYSQGVYSNWAQV